MTNTEKAYKVYLVFGKHAVESDHPIQVKQTGALMHKVALKSYELAHQ